MGTFVPEIRPSEVDVVIAALKPDLKFLEAWRSMLEPFHMIIVQGGESHRPLQVPQGFDADVYTQSDIAKALGPKLASSLSFKGTSCKNFGYLVSKKQYVFTLDDDCVPAQDPAGDAVNPLLQHVTNLKNPSTPLFFNTLYDPYRDGADFVRGYPFSLREGLPTAISHGLWLNVPDYDPPTHILKPTELNTKYVDAVVTIPKNVLFSLSGINIAFDRSLVGPAMYMAQVGSVIGEQLRCNGIEDLWAGLCCKVICDHFSYGVKSGLPYVWRNKTEHHGAALHKDYKGFQWMEQIVPFFQTVRLSSNALTVQDCYLELANHVKSKLTVLDPSFGKLAASMEAWIEAWEKLSSK